jgi:hypothetical protein
VLRRPVRFREAPHLTKRSRSFDAWCSNFDLVSIKTTKPEVRQSAHGLSVEHLARCVGMSCAVGGLLDEMQDHPSKVKGCFESEENVCRRPISFAARAVNLKARCRTDKSVGVLRLVPVRVDHIR